MRTRVCLIVAIGMTAGMGLWATPAIAAGASSSPSVTVTPSQAHPQGKIQAVGLGFVAGRVNVLFDGTLVGHGPPSSAGRVQISFRIPRSALPGEHTVRLTEGGRTAKTIMLVRTNWAQSGFNTRDTGNNPYENVLTPKTVSGLTELWNSGGPLVNGQWYEGMSVANGTVYVGLYSQGDPSSESFVSFNADTGASSTVVDGAGPWWAPTVTSSDLYFSYPDLVAFSTDGKFLWQVDNTGGGAALKDNTIYSGGTSALYAVDATTGAVAWSIPVAAPITVAPVAVDGDMAFASSGPDLWAFNLTSRKVAWEMQGVSSAPALGRPTVGDGVVVVNGPLNQNGNGHSTVTGYDETTGSILWQVEGAALGSQGLVEGDALFLAGPQGIEALNITSGHRIWSNSVSASPEALAGGVLYTHTATGVGALDASTGAELWNEGRAERWAPESAPVIVNGVLYDASTLGVTAFSLKN
jgi:hypothetical protein